MKKVSLTSAMPLRLSREIRDRKSTRLNSSHLVISYAVFCLKKKKHHVRMALPHGLHEFRTAPAFLLLPAQTRHTYRCSRTPHPHSHHRPQTARETDSRRTTSHPRCARPKSPPAPLPRRPGPQRSHVHHALTQSQPAERTAAPHAPRLPLGWSRSAAASLFFFFNEGAPPEFYPLSLHAALPI